MTNGSLVLSFVLCTYAIWRFGDKVFFSQMLNERGSSLYEQIIFSVIFRNASPNKINLKILKPSYYTWPNEKCKENTHKKKSKNKKPTKKTPYFYMSQTKYINNIKNPKYTESSLKYALNIILHTQFSIYENNHISPSSLGTRFLVPYTI